MRLERFTKNASSLYVWRRRERENTRLILLRENICLCRNDLRCWLLDCVGIRKDKRRLFFGVYIHRYFNRLPFVYTMSATPGRTYWNCAQVCTIFYSFANFTPMDRIWMTKCLSSSKQTSILKNMTPVS